MNDSTALHRDRDGDAESKRVIPELAEGPAPRKRPGGAPLPPSRVLMWWAGLLIVWWYRCGQSRRDGKTLDEVRLRLDMTDDELEELEDDVVEAIFELNGQDQPVEAFSAIGGFWLSVKRLRKTDESRETAAWGDFLDWLGALDLADPADRRHAAHAFDGYVRQVAGRDRDAGVFVTPEPVVNLMLDLAAPAPGERVYDPCFGYGGLLAGAVRRMQAANGAATTGASVPLAAVAGVERNEFTYLVGLCRVALSGAVSLRLERADALEKPVPDEAEAGFDCILAVPPVESWQAGDYEEKVDGPFLRHVMGQLRPGGRAVVALPERPLFHADTLPLRKELLSDYHVRRVVALPAGAFEPHSAIPMNIVVFSRDEPRDAVRFAAVSPMAWEAAQEDAAAISERLSDRPAPAGSVSTGVESWSVPVRELGLRSYELLVKPSDGALEAAIKRLRAEAPELKVMQLEDVADIRQEDVDEDEVLESQPNRGVGAVLRPADVTGARIRLPTAILHLPRDLYGEFFLRDADLLVPLEDAIGNIGLIESGGAWNLVIVDGAIAVVRAGDGISPQFLAAMLRSPAYWYWFWSHAEGSTIRQLSVEVLRTLPIPVPSAPVQDAVLQELSEQRADALAVLHRVLSGAKKNPVADWLETRLPARLAAAGAADGLDAGALSELASGILAIGDTDYQSCGAWLGAARKAAATLKGYDAVPSASGRLVILEHALVRFHEALHAIGRSEEELFDRLRSCTRGMMGLAEREAGALQRAAKVDVDVTPPEVEAGVPCEVRLRVTNGPVPLRDLQVTARQPDGAAATDGAAYLAEGATYEMPVAVRARDSAESHRIDVAWQARRLDAEPPIGGELEVHVLAASGQADDLGDLGRSPYIVGNPVDRADMFFGRAGIMDRIRRHLGGGDHANVILLEGNRRTGKTSILRHLGKTGALPGWIPVYCSFQELDGIAAADVFKLLALRIGGGLWDAGIETWIPDLERADSGRPFKIVFGSALRRAFAGGRPFETLELYLEAAIRAAKPRRILLMIDEFDKLREGIDSGLTGPQVPENLRHLLQHQAGLGAIITGSRRLKKLREEYWSALFGLGYRIGVSALPKDQARRLVTEPVAGRLRYLPQARDRLVEICAGHPFLIQSLCSRVFDQAADGGERTITPDVLDRAVTDMLRDNEHFRTLWDYAGTERRRLILALCHRLAYGSDAINIPLLLRQFEERGVRVRRDQEMADDIAELRELELVDLDTSYRGGTYRLSVELMARWIEMNVDFDELVVRTRMKAERR